MKTLTHPDHRLLMAATSAALAVAAMSFVGTSHARDNVSLSIGIVVPGVVYPSHAYPVYTQPPVYVQPRPVYVQPAPIYYQPAPVYYAVPQPVYYERPDGWKHGKYKKHKKHDRDDDDRYERHDGYQRSYYAPIYYRR